jgi:zinc transport system substrate-binding protein
MKKSLLYLTLLIFTLLFCTSQQEQETVKTDNTQPLIFVSNYPLKYFTERMASSLVDIQFPANSARDPAYWQPTSEEIVAMQQANLIILNGASYEQWIKNATLPQSKLIETSAGFVDQLIPLEETVTHSHGLEGEHEHAGTAFTTWLDMTLAVEQARAIQRALTKLLAEHNAQLEENFKNLEADLQALDEQLNSIVSKSPDQKVIFSHPVYQYLERRYNMKGMSVHWEPEELPDDGMWNEFKHILEHHPAKWLIWEGEPDAQTVSELEKRGVKSVVFDPCGTEPEAGDFLTVMSDNMEALQKIYGK